MLDGSAGLIIEPPVVDIIISTHRNLEGSAQDGLFHQGRELIAIGALENGAFCTVFSENFHKF
jgi:hypothetical protein